MASTELKRKPKKLKLKSCRICKNKFEPYSSLSVTCSIPCSIKLVNDKKAKKTLAKLKLDIKIEKMEQRKAKENLKSKSQWLAEAQKEFNKFIRLRDHREGCISCGSNDDHIKYDAGHYKSRGAHPELRFDESNVAKQCSMNCNMKLSGNIIEFRKGLFIKIGEKELERIEGHNPPKNYTISDIKEIKTKYRKKWRELEKQLFD